MTRILQAEDVTELIGQAKNAGADPVGTVTRILQGLGDSASVTGEVVGQALAQLGIAVPPEAGDMLRAVQSIIKDGDLVEVQLASQVQSVVRGTPLRLGPAITFAVQNFPDGMAMADLTGVSVNKFMWIDIQRVQFHETEGRRSVRVDTSLGGKEFVLP
jgi:hypothetical protein